MTAEIQKQNGSRIIYLDALKGFAAVCVVLGHVVDGYVSGNTYPEATSVLGLIYDAIYAFHMPLFMMISGCVFAKIYLYNDENCVRVHGKKLKKQMGNVLCLYWIFCFLMWLFKMLFRSYVNTAVTWTDLLLLPVKAIAPYWYLYVLLVLYVIFSLQKVRNASPKWLLALTAGICAASSFVPAVEAFEIRQILFYAFFFYLGVVYAQKPEWMIFREKTGVVWMLAAAAVFAVFAWNGRSSVRKIPAVNMFVSTGISLGLFAIFRKTLNSRSGFTAFLGRNALEIYLLHCFLTAGLRTVFVKIGIDNAAISVLLNLAVSIAVCVGVSAVMKKIGWHRFLFKPYSALCKS